MTVVDYGVATAVERDVVVANVSPARWCSGFCPRITRGVRSSPIRRCEEPQATRQSHGDRPERISAEDSGAVARDSQGHLGGAMPPLCGRHRALCDECGGAQALRIGGWVVPRRMWCCDPSRPIKLGELQTQTRSVRRLNAGLASRRKNRSRPLCLKVRSMRRVSIAY